MQYFDASSSTAQPGAMGGAITLAEVRTSDLGWRYNTGDVAEP